jgi:hypothetical protein
MSAPANGSEAKKVLVPGAAAAEGGNVYTESYRLIDGCLVIAFLARGINSSVKGEKLAWVNYAFAAQFAIDLTCNLATSGPSENKFPGQATARKVWRKLRGKAATDETASP